MKTIKPREVTESGYYWATGPDDTEVVYIDEGGKAKDFNGNYFWPDKVYKKLRGPIPCPWKMTD